MTDLYPTVIYHICHMIFIIFKYNICLQQTVKILIKHHSYSSH